MDQASGAIPSGPYLIRIKGYRKKIKTKTFDFPIWTDENGYVTTMMLKACIGWLFGVHKNRIVEVLENHGNIVTEATAKRA